MSKQMNKGWKRLKQKQKAKISCRMRDEYLNFEADQQRFPEEDEFEAMIDRVIPKVQGSGISRDELASVYLKKVTKWHRKLNSEGLEEPDFIALVTKKIELENEAKKVKTKREINQYKSRPKRKKKKLEPEISFEEACQMDPIFAWQAGAYEYLEEFYNN